MATVSARNAILAGSAIDLSSGDNCLIDAKKATKLYSSPSTGDHLKYAASQVDESFEINEQLMVPVCRYKFLPLPLVLSSF
jgi:hypothetical protein